MKKIILKKNEDRRLRAGHFWVFSNEIDVKRTPLREFAPGEEAALLDSRGQCLGTVYVNPNSLIAARLLSREAGQGLGGGEFRRRLELALQWREQLYDQPFYRLAHAEADGLPGLILDRYGPVCVGQISTAGMEARKEDLLRAVREVLDPELFILRNDVAGRALEGLSMEDPGLEVLIGPAASALPARLEVLEQGLAFTVPLGLGQKTGWFYDQRENRARTAKFAAGLKPGGSVLDVFSYVGGFGCAAARAGGAAELAFVDASASALELAAQNAGRIAPEARAAVYCGDAMEIMAELRERGQRFDLVCLDPPAFIKRKKDEAAGLGAYQRCNELALDLVAPGGLLVSSSCSQHLPAEELRRIIARAAARRRKPVRLVGTGRQAPDHPSLPAMPELEYLKTFFLTISA